MSLEEAYKLAAGPEIISVGKLDEPPPYHGPWGGRLARNYATILHGEGGAGKSFLTMAMASCAAQGLPLLGLELPHGPSLLLDYELSQEEQTRRAYRVARGLGLSRPPQDLLYLAGERPILDIYDDIKNAIESRGIKFLVIDSFGPGAGVKPEDAEAVIGVLNKIKDLGVTSLLLDHQSKLQDGQVYSGKTPFGSVYKMNLARSVLRLERVRGDKGEIRLLLTQTKHNFGPIADDLSLAIKFEQGEVRFETLEPEPTYDPSEKILMAMEYPITALDIALKINEKKKTVLSRLAKMAASGDVGKVGKIGKEDLWGRNNGNGTGLFRDGQGGVPGGNGEGPQESSTEDV